ncbi:MlaD family protein [Marinobacter nanhaiticus D15-8W]|uniref:MCE family protein n=1 Tax=Marinobacter nanhaiticus D15-8W TaxID=626887 RepID=N6VSY4_9GAMM|nr:MlaD family protein [Marinobacter nanhaiticus]ENO13240.1 MCE family protein [Marinobacter nanhaiticus D15-8W]BES70602.1 MlaD family protein [Marinobacter nanhaiticus D15-8W]
MSDNREYREPGEADVKSRRWGLSLVWLVPLVATLVGLSMLIRAWHEAGPTIRITFETAGSLAPEKSPIKYRNVVIGEVTGVRLSEDHEKVIVTAQLNREASSFTREDSRYWVVRPRIGAEGISGLDTLLSGDFIAADPGTSSQRSETFQGLESPPPVTYGEPGKRFQLKAQDLGSLDIGSPVYYRKVRVGQVVSYKLDESGDGVNVDVFIAAPNDRFVTNDTRFWNASGIDVGVSANGLDIDTQSLISVVAGGIAFGTPSYKRAPEPAESGTEFPLFAERETALAPNKGPALEIRMRFDESLRGLHEGAPVDFMGKRIGEVTSVSLDYDTNQQTFPVIVEARVHPRLMGRAYDKLLESVDNQVSDDNVMPRLFNTFVLQGLRAEARTSNLLTGQMHVSMEFYPDLEPVEVEVTRRPVVIPTRPTSLAQLQDQLMALVDRLSEVPFKSIAGNMDSSLAELRQTLEQINDNVLPQALGALQSIDTTMNDMQDTLGTAAEALDPASPERQRLGHALDEVERMSRSVRELTDYLRRHPESLIQGRPEAQRRNLQP